MRAAVLYAPKDLRIEPVAAAPLGPGEVEVRIEAGGICGSDLHYYFDGGFGTVRLREPMILGHEIAGTVARVGTDVASIAPGQRVAVNPSRPCGACRYCAEGKQQHCLDMRFYGSAMRFPHVQGGFREVLVCDATQAVPVPATMSAAQAAFAEPFAVCLHAVNRAGPLLGKRVLVTGAGPIGALTVIAARRAGALEIVATDVADPKSVANLFAKTKEKFGRLDVLFNNAGTGAPGTINLEDLTFEQWQSVVNTNLTGPFLCTQEAFKIMKAQSPMGGRIINNGSISAHVPRPNSAPYTSTKHAITGLTRSASLDGRKYNIACGQIDIGNAASGMAANMNAGMPQANGSIAPEPTMDVQDVARSVIFMASLPLDSNVQFMTVMATKMPFIGRG